MLWRNNKTTMVTIKNKESMEDNKYNTLQEQISKIDEFIKVQTEQFGEEFEDEVNYLAIVKTNLEEVKK